MTALLAPDQVSSRLFGHAVAGGLMDSDEDRARAAYDEASGAHDRVSPERSRPVRTPIAARSFTPPRRSPVSPQITRIPNTC